MPSAPKKPCRARMCRGFGSGNEPWCDDHLREKNIKRWSEQDTKRPSASKRGYGRRWQRLRLMVLRREPMCRHCKDRAASDVDHIISKQRGGQDTMDNLQGLCGTCHARKTIRDGEAFVPRDYTPPGRQG